MFIFVWSAPFNNTCEIIKYCTMDHNLLDEDNTKVLYIVHAYSGKTDLLNLYFR